MNLRVVQTACRIAITLLLSGCASTVHKDFAANLVKDSRNNDGSFKSMVVSLAYDDRQKYLAVGHESGRIDIWDAKKPASKREIKAHDHRANWLSFNSDGNSVFSNSYFENLTNIWNAKTGDLLYSIPDTRGPVCVTSDEDIVLVGQGARFAVFDLGRRLLLPDKYETSGVILVMTKHVASKQVAIGTALGSIEIWQYLGQDGRPSLRRLRSAKPYDTGNWVVGLQFSPDGTALYSIARSGLLDEWATDSLEKRRALPTTLKHIRSVSNLEGKGLLALGGTTDQQGVGRGFVELVDLASGTSTTNPVNTNVPVVTFIPSPTMLVTAQSRSISVDKLEATD